MWVPRWGQVPPALARTVRKEVNLVAWMLRKKPMVGVPSLCVKPDLP